MKETASALHIRARDAQGQVVDVARVGRGSLTIGSAGHNALVLPAPDVAPVQFRVDWDGVSPNVTLTNIGAEQGIYVGNLRVQPHGSLLWDGSQIVRVGPYSLKLIGLPTPSINDMPSPTQKPSTQSARPPRWPLFAAAALAVLALAVVVFALLSRPAEIVSFAFADSGGQLSVRYIVRNAKFTVLWADGAATDIERLKVDAQTGEVSYTPKPQERTFELVAYNALGQPTRSTLSLALQPTPVPTVTPTPNPTNTPLPNDPFVAEFAFNGLNKANELSDVLLNRGEGLVISWDVANVTGIELQPAGTFKAKDSIRVAPQETTVYTLVARNSFGEAKRSVKVIVVDAQATSSVNATASAGAKATQDAINAAGAQAASTATASTRATATTIALVLADAQARATEAASEATATASAQATAIALGTAQAGATQQVIDASGATATAIVLATAQDVTRFAQFNGVWVNDTPLAVGIVRLEISNAGPSVTVQAFDACTPQPCNWGPRTQTYTDAPFLVRYDFGDGSSRTLLLERDGDKLRVQDVDSRGPVRVYMFSRVG